MTNFSITIQGFQSQPPSQTDIFSSLVLSETTLFCEDIVLTLLPMCLYMFTVVECVCIRYSFIYILTLQSYSRHSLNYHTTVISKRLKILCGSNTQYQYNIKPLRPTSHFPCHLRDIIKTLKNTQFKKVLFIVYLYSFLRSNVL